MPQRYVLKNAKGESLRTIVTKTEKAFLVQLAFSKRLKLLGSEAEVEALRKKKEPVKELGVVDFTTKPVKFQLSDGYSILEAEESDRVLSDVDLKSENSVRYFATLGSIVVLCALFIGVLMNLNLGMHTLEQELKTQVVQIVKKIPPKQVKTEIQNTKSLETKAVAKTSMQRMGALSVLGSLNKSGQKGGLNLGAVQTTAGPGLGGTGGSGGVQTNIYARGLASAPLGAGGNLQGGGGYGTKGKGGGQAGYGTLSIVGSRGTSSIPLTSEASVGGGLDKSLIGGIIMQNLGQVKFCYEQGLQLDSSLHGRVAVDFVINGDGAVKSASIANSSVNSKIVEDCLLMRLKSWKFPLPENGKEVKVSYPFVLRKEGQG